MLLEGKTAIVTGAASPRGIGKATARLFAEHGARLALLDLDRDASAAAAADIGPAHLGLACDVTDKQACERAAGQVIDAFGGLDVLVNNAGISVSLGIVEIGIEDYERVMDINLRGAMYMSQAVIPHFRERRAGAIVCLGSVAGQRGGGLFGGPHYAASKAAIMGLAKAMARELAPEGVRVNAVAPGMIDTDIFHGALTPERRQAARAGVPLGRLGRAEEVAGACLFLASDLASYVTGAVIDVNGGSLIH